LDISEQILYSSTQMFEGGQITKEKLSKAQVEVLSEERTMLTLLMEKRVVINNIKRLLSADATLLDNNTPQTSSSVEVIVNISNKNVQLSVRSIGELNNSIVSVKYEVESFKRPSRSTDSSSDFLSIYKFRRNGVYNVTATITLSSGQTIVETTQIKL
jgi:hypothetical protein